jgi:hypothetical protein
VRIETLAIVIACLSLLVSGASFVVPLIARRIRARRSAAEFVATAEKFQRAKEKRAAAIVTDPANYGGKAQ